MDSPNKHQILAEDCLQIQKATHEALEWLSDNEDVVGARSGDVFRTLKKGAVEARKLATAAQRPVSAGVFGPSQVGKSFFIGTLVEGPSETHTPGKSVGNVLFGTGSEQESLNFIHEVNPQGGDETTGLVTRFTSQTQKSPPGYPVCLRLLREIDLVKILVNAFVFDLQVDAITPLTQDHIATVIETAEQKLDPSFSDNLIVEDVFELEEYIEFAINTRHPIQGDLAAYYWSNVEKLLPRLALEARAALFAPLWGEIPEFTALYIKLKQALDKLGHPEWAFASLDSIRNRLPGETILHVLTMKRGLDDDVGHELAELATLKGITVKLPKPAITALVMELSVTLEEISWPFLETTDLLDFPGARSRYDKKREQYFQAVQEYPIGEAFLRGKVAVLFDNYAANIELNTLVACHRAEQIKVEKFPDLVQEWVARTHGAKPADRSAAEKNLFFAVTWCDLMLDIASGMTRKDVKIDNCLRMLDRFAWLHEWTPGTSFDQTYLVRNPNGKKLEDIYDYDPPEAAQGYTEIAVKPTKVEWLNEYQPAFLGTKYAQTLFKDPQVCWERMVTPNDGGVQLLATALNESCEPDVKYKQIVPKFIALHKSILETISPFFESGGLAERLQARLASIVAVIDTLQDDDDLLPRFVSELQTTPDLVRQTYIDYRRSRQQGGLRAAENRVSFGQVVTARWVETVSKKKENAELLASYNLDSDQFQCVLSEIEIAARLSSMSEALDREVNRIEGFGGKSEQIADLVASTVSMRMGEFVSSLGHKGWIRLQDLEAHTLFRTEPKLQNGEFPDFPDRLEDMSSVRKGYGRDWFDGLRTMTRINASSASGGVVDIEQNERLGNIIDGISDLQSAR